MISIWDETCDIPEYDRLHEDINTTVAVIGGGMAGLLTAYKLYKNGIDTVVVDANRICNGVTKGTTAKITSQHDLIYDKLFESKGLIMAKQYAMSNEHAIEKFAKIVEEEEIKCDFERRPAYVYSLDNENRIEAEVKAAQLLGIDAHYVTETELPFKIKAAVKFENQAQFHPLKFLKKIASMLTIFENTKVIRIENNIVETTSGNIKADYIVVATHFPFLDVPGYYFTRLIQDRSYLLALENAESINGMYIDADNSGFTFRSYDNYLLFGGAGHRTGESTGGAYNKLISASKNYYPNAQVVAQWSAQDCITPDNLPFIGKYSNGTPNVFVMTGFKKWGMSLSMVSASLITDLIMEKDNPYVELYTPQRFIDSSSTAKNVVFNVSKYAKKFAERQFKTPNTTLDEIPNGHGGLVEMDKKKAGAFKEEDGTTHLVSTKCPHMGCQLEFNSDEHTWECPCHGSRFDHTGKLLNNPANEDLKHDILNQ